MAAITGRPDGSVIIDTRINTAGFGKGTAGLKSQFQGLSKAAGKLGMVIAAAFSVKAIVAFSKEAIALGSDLQEVQNVVDVTFTTMNEQINEFAKNAAMTAGLSETMAKRYAGTFGAMAKSFKFSEQEAYSMATALTQLSGDVASFYNLTQDEAYTKLKSVFTGETESLKDLGVVMTQTALDDFALRKGLGKTVNKMTEQEKVALRYQFVLEQLSGASGDFVRTQDGWANQTRILNLQFNQLKATIGQGLINVLTPVLKMINELISKFQVLAYRFKAFTETIFGNAGKGAGAAIESVTESTEALGDATEEAGKKAQKSLAPFDEITKLSGSSENEDGGAIGPAGSAQVPAVTVPVTPDVTDNITPKIEGMVEKIKRIFSDLSNTFDTLFSPSIFAWGDAFTSVLPSVQSAAIKVGTAFSNLWSESLAPFGSYVLKDLIPSIVSSFSNTFAPIFADILPVAVDTFATNFENKTKIVEKAIGWITEGFEKVRRFFTDMCASVSESWDKYGGGLLTEFKTFVDNAWDTWWKFYDEIIDPVFSKVSQTIDEIWDESLKPLWDKLVEFVMSVSADILHIYNVALKPVIDWLISKMAPKIKEFVGYASAQIKDFAKLITDKIGAALENVRILFRGIADFVDKIAKGDMKGALDGLTKTFETMWENVKNSGKSSINSIIRMFNRLIEAVYGGVSDFINGFGGVIRDIGAFLGKDNWGFSIPTKPPAIPYLAQGAVIPPNAPFMAVLGDQRHGTNIEAPLSTIQEAVEAVMESKFADMMSGFAETVAVLREILEAVYGIQIGDDVLWQAVNRYNRKMNIARGGPL